MMNTTRGELVFLHSDEELRLSVPAALAKTCELIMKASGLEHIDIEAVTSKTNREFLFVKYTRSATLNNASEFFDRAYLLEVYRIYMAGQAAMNAADFERVTGGSAFSVPYVKTGAIGMVSGLGAFLLQLHIDGALILPAAFPWPELTGGEYGLVLDCELLKLVRSTSLTKGVAHKSFEFLTDSGYGRANFLSCATKLLLALNWKRPGDANMADIIALDIENQQTGNIGHACGHAKALVTFLHRHYGQGVSVSARAWDEHLTGRTRRAIKLQKKIAKTSEALDPLTCDPMNGSEEYLTHRLSPERLKDAKLWFELQRIYLKRQKRRREQHNLELYLRYLNMYLFLHLPAWYEENPGTNIAFPSEPSKLISSIFVSSLLEHDFAVPMTLAEFFRDSAVARPWSPQVHYSYLKGVEGFFDFLEKNGAELPGCSGFKQPLGTHDYPYQSGARGTTKRPIPRRIFPFYLLYVEALIAYSHAVTARMIEGVITPNHVVEIFDTKKRTVFDTFQLSDLVGFVPIVFWQGRCIPLQFIPNCLANDEKHQLRNGQVLKIPQPHALIHILVALYTGLRNQHIQWLDVRTFDRDAQEGGDFSYLYVNTDKVKTRPWTPHVNQRVMTALREQKAWRDLIDQRSFQDEHWYEFMESSKWGMIRPLFAVGAYGHPHADSRYQTCWDNILMGVQGCMSEIENVLGERVDPLFTLLPPRVRADAEDIDRLRRELHGEIPGSDDGSERYVQLFPKGDITPHSARVGVVSHYIQVLPADLIGRYITGQSEGLVYHYAVLDRADVERARDVQATALQVKIFGQDLGAVTASGGPKLARHIKADAVNSALVRSFATGNIDETIERFGCISITLNDGGQSGIDVLKSTRASGAAFNKCEICPYGNHCPPDVVKALRGFRRCGMCPYAVRSIEHLPPVAAKRKQLSEQMAEIEQRIKAGGLSGEEIDQLEAERQRLSGEAVGYRLSEEVLERQRHLIATGKDTRRWVVPMPDIIQQGLSQVAVPSDDVSYLLARLSECVAYPAFDSPSIRAKFDLVRRQLLAGTGRVREAFAAAPPGNPALECVALLKSVADAHGIDYERIPSLIASAAEGSSLTPVVSYFLPRSVGDE